MAEARAKLVDGMQRIAALRGLPEHRRAEPEAQAFEALRGGFVGARRDEAILDGFEEHEMRGALELVAKRGAEKRMLRGRAIECLKGAFGRPAWVRAAQSRPDLLASLRELLEETPELLAALEEAPPPTAELEAGVGPLTPRVSLFDRNPDVERLLSDGRDVMRFFGWEFPDDPLGTKIDKATAGFQSFFDGVTRLTTVSGKASVAGGVSELLESFQSEWPGILQFHVSMYESGKRNVYRSRIKFVVVKLRELSPGFGELVAQREGGLPWSIPCAASVAPDGASGLLAAVPAQSSTASARTSPAPPTSLPPPPPRPGVVWIDFKAKAYNSSSLNTEATIEFVGFHDDEAAPDYAPRDRWLAYILERAEDPARRVAVVILNRKHLQAVKDIRAFCMDAGHAPPKFVVCTRGRPEEFAEWGIDPGFITQDWVRAAELAMVAVRMLL